MPCLPVAPPRRGLSLLEVAIVVVLVLLVAGVAVVALRGWWESSHRALCTNHLREMGKAITVHQETKKYLPASRIAKEYATWAVQLAPYLESTAPLRKWDLTRTYYAQPEPVRQAQVSLFYCPSRRYPPQLSIAGDVPSDGAQGLVLFAGALGDYACCSGDGSTDWETDAGNGAIIPAKVLKKEGDQIVDWEPLTDLKGLERGLAATMLVGEKHVPWGEFGKVAAGDGSLYNGDYLASSARVGGKNFGLAQSISAPFHSNFGSYHPGICQFLMADGAVHALENSMDEDVLGKLTRR